MRSSEYIPDLYPDLLQHGGLPNALQAALSQIGSSISTTELDGSLHFHEDASIGSGERVAYITTDSFVGTSMRMFALYFSNRGFYRIYGRTPDLHGVARAVDRWIARGCSTSELINAFDFVSLPPSAREQEPGEGLECDDDTLWHPLDGTERERVSISYSPVEDVFVIAFEDETIFPDPVPKCPTARPGRAGGRWSMFTHGVCWLTLAHFPGYSVKQLAFTGWHLPEPADPQDFAFRLRRTADRLQEMAIMLTEHSGPNLDARQKHYAADVLRKYHHELVIALMVASQKRRIQLEEEGQI